MCAKKIEVINSNRYNNIIKSKLHSIEVNVQHNIQQLKEEQADETLDKLLKENNIKDAIQYKQDLLLKDKINLDNEPKK